MWRGEQAQRLRQRTRLNQLSRCNILIALGLLEERLDNEHINSMAPIMRTKAHLFSFFAPRARLCPPTGSSSSAPDAPLPASQNAVPSEKYQLSKPSSAMP